MRSKESGKVRYAYGVAMALLLGGSAFSLTTGRAGAQVPQNAPGTSSLAPRPGAPMSFADLVSKLQPAVVNISTEQRIPARRSTDPFEQIFRQMDPTQPQGNSGANDNQGRTQKAGSLGSGFILSPNGYIVTNNHLIQGLTGTGTVDTVTVTTYDGKEYPARIIGRDDTSDLALLKIEANNLPFVEWGDSTKSRVGDWVIAIGDPYGVGSTVTAGIISALHRSITEQGGAYDRYIQTDASINMGNSGGPMFDLNGNVIGINSALISPTGASVGIGLAIPAELAKPVIDALMKGQRPVRGYLGVGLQGIDEDVAGTLVGISKNSGEIIQTVVPNGPAARAGLQIGDVIVKVNGHDVTQNQTVSYLIANSPVGKPIPIEIIRNAASKPQRGTVYVTLADRPTEEALNKIGAGQSETPGTTAPGATSAQTALGLSLAPLTPELARAANLPAGVHGVIVTAVDANSDAGDKGFRRGDLIVSVNNQQVTTPAQVTAVVDAAKKAGRTSVLLLVKRGSSPEQFVAVDISSK